MGSKPVKYRLAYRNYQSSDHRGGANVPDVYGLLGFQLYWANLRTIE